MNYRTLLVVLSLLAAGSAADIEVGSCTISDPGDSAVKFDDTSITISKNDNEDIEVTLPVDGNLVLTLSSFPVSLYINVSQDASNLKVVGTDAMKMFDALQTVHTEKQTMSLSRNFSVSCEGETADIALIVEITDVNTYPPTFSYPHYDYKLPKMLLPDYDLTTVLKGNPIIIEDIDFSNINIDLNIEPPGIFNIKAEPQDDSNRTFVGILSVAKSYNISAPINLTVMAIDNGSPPLNTTATITISAPNMIGDCTIDDFGYLDYGFFEDTILDNATEYTLSFSYEGSLVVDTPNSEDSGASYINVTKTDATIDFTLNADNFKTFDEDHISEVTQPTITVFKSVVLSCGVEEKGFTFGLVVEDVNNHAPTFVNNPGKYSLPKPLMPRVDLTSAGEPIIVEDLDFSNTDITFTVDAPFSIETVPVESIENKRQYRAALRVSEYISSFGDDEDSMEITIMAIDSGNPPLNTNLTVTIELI